MSDSDFPVMAGSRLGFDLKELVGLRQGLSGGGVAELMRAARADKLIPRSFGLQDPMAPEGSGWLYDGTQPPEAFGI